MVVISIGFDILAGISRKNENPMQIEVVNIRKTLVFASKSRSWHNYQKIAPIALFCAEPMNADFLVFYKVVFHWVLRLQENIHKCKYSIQYP